MGDDAAEVGMMEMTPKSVWRVLNVTLVAACTAAAVILGGFTPWLGIVAFGISAIGAFRDYIRVEVGVIYRRTLLGWDPPMLLSELQTVEIFRFWYQGLPHTVVLLVARDGARRTVTLRWWSNWEALLRAIAASVTAPAPSQPGLLVWRLDLDANTRRKLAPYLP